MSPSTSATRWTGRSGAGYGCSRGWRVVERSAGVAPGERFLAPIGRELRAGPATTASAFELATQPRTPSQHRWPGATAAAPTTAAARRAAGRGGGRVRAHGPDPDASEVRHRPELSLRFRSLVRALRAAGASHGASPGFPQNRGVTVAIASHLWKFLAIPTVERCPHSPGRLLLIAGSASGSV